MADKFFFLKSWYDAILEDDYVKTTEQEMAYIVYAAMRYYFDGKPIDIGEIFGKEFQGLNRSMPNIYNQIDRIKGYDQGRVTKYDAEEIKKLRLKGYTAKQICKELGYDEAAAKSLTSNAGWKEANRLRAER